MRQGSWVVAFVVLGCCAVSAQDGGNIAWALSFGGGRGTDTAAPVVAVDPTGSILVAGRSNDERDPEWFGPYVAKFSDGGILRWHTNLYKAGLSLKYFIRAIAGDAAGNVFVTGSTAKSSKIEVYPKGGGYGVIFLTKLSKDGDLLWTREFSVGAHEFKKNVGGRTEPRSILVDSAGEVLICGYVQGTVNFDGKTYGSSQASLDSFVAKFSTDGTLRWANRVDSPGDDLATDLALDPAGNIVVVGSVNGPIDFGLGTLVGGESYDIYVATYSPNGVCTSSKRFVAVGRNRLADTRVAVDRKGNIVLLSQGGKTIHFGGDVQAPPGDGYFLAKLSSDFRLDWFKGIGGYSQEDSAEGLRLVVDHEDNILVGGFAWGQVDFGTGPLEVGNYLVKYTPVGGLTWIAKPSVLVSGLAVTANNEPLISGEFVGTFTYGTTALRAHGKFDAILIKYKP